MCEIIECVTLVIECVTLLIHTRVGVRVWDVSMLSSVNLIHLLPLLVLLLLLVSPVLTLQACCARRGPCKSPMTLLPMQSHLVPNHTLRSLIKEWQQQQQQQL